MVEQGSSSGHINAVDKSLQIVGFLRRTGGADLRPIAAHIDRAESTTYDHLQTLIDGEYLVKDGTEYRVSFKFLDVGAAKRESLPLIDLVRDVQEQLAKETNEITWYVVEEHGRAVFINKETGERAVQPYGQVGKRTTMHDIAAGKAILSRLPRERVEEIIDAHGLTQKTEATITEREELHDELAAIGERGVAYNTGENVDNWRAVASPVLLDGEVHGAIAVSGPEDRMQGDRFNETVSRLVSGAANQISLQFQST